MRTPNGYWFGRADLPQLKIQTFYPERTGNESAVIRDFLNAHGDEFDRFGFSIRIGQSANPDPSHLIGVQRSTIWSNRKRIDLVCLSGQAVALVEAKMRVQPAALGQILTYRKLWLEDNPESADPRLIVIGRYTDQDTIGALNAHGVDVYIYDRDVTE